MLNYKIIDMQVLFRWCDSIGQSSHIVFLNHRTQRPVYILTRYLRMIWATLLLYFFASSCILGSLIGVGESALATLFGRHRGL